MWSPVRPAFSFAVVFFPFALVLPAALFTAFPPFTGLPPLAGSRLVAVRLAPRRSRRGGFVRRASRTGRPAASQRTRRSRAAIRTAPKKPSFVRRPFEAAFPTATSAPPADRRWRANRRSGAAIRRGACGYTCCSGTLRGSRDRPGTGPIRWAGSLSRGFGSRACSWLAARVDRSDLCRSSLSSSLHLCVLRLASRVSRLATCDLRLATCVSLPDLRVSLSLSRSPCFSSRLASRVVGAFALRSFRFSPARVPCSRWLAPLAS